MRAAIFKCGDGAISCTPEQHRLAEDCAWYKVLARELAGEGGHVPRIPDEHDDSSANPKAALAFHTAVSLSISAVYGRISCWTVVHAFEGRDRWGGSELR